MKHYARGRPAAEPCPSCGCPIADADAYCLTCGESGGGCVESTPREDYLRACVSALELIRQTGRRVRPLAETRRAEADLEVAISKIRSGAAL